MKRAEKLCSPGDKFALLACSGPVDANQLPYRVSDRLIVVAGSVALDDWWQGALGEFTCNRLGESSYAVLAHAPSNRPEVLDHETKTLEHEALFFRDALSLSGVYQTDEPQLIRGYADSEGLKPRQHCLCHLRYRGRGVFSEPLDSASLWRGMDAYNGIRSIQGVGDARHFGWGMQIFLEGLTQQTSDERVLAFVRAVECSQATTKKDLGADFIAKCLRISAENFTERQFEHAYKIRNNVVHMNPFEDIWFGRTDAPSAVEYIGQCADMMELFTRELYRLLLSTPEHLATFSDRAKIRDFWLNPVGITIARHQTARGWRVSHPGTPRPSG